MNLDGQIKTKTLSEQPWHGNSKLFGNRMNAFFSDTSYQKYEKEKRIKEKALESLNDKYHELSQQEKLKNLAVISRKTNEKWNEIRKNAISEHFVQQKNSEIAAILIQKHIRGFLSRLKIENQVMQLRESRTNYLIHETEQISNVCLFHLGDCVSPAALILQKSLKNYLFRLKLKRLLHAYNLFLEAKSKKASDEIRKFLLKFACKEKIESILFEKFRTKRLNEIKENLAVLKVKKFWKIRKLNFKLLRDKILRLKRRKTALATKEKFAKMLTNSKPDKPIVRSLTKSISFEYSEEDELDVPENAEARQRAREEQERIEKEKQAHQKAFQEKVSVAKLAHGLKDKANPVVLPFLQERELSEIVTSSLEVRLYETTFSSAQKSKKFNREISPVMRNTQIHSPSKVWQKRLSVPNHTLPPLLLSDNQYVKRCEKSVELAEVKEFSVNSHRSQCKRHDESEEHSFQPNPQNRHFVLRKQFLSKGTVAQMMKKEERRVRLDQGKVWKIGRKYSEYVSGVDNTSFEKKPWKALRLDRSILETNTSTNFGSGNIKTHLRKNSDPASYMSLLSN